MKSARSELFLHQNPVFTIELQQKIEKERKDYSLLLLKVIQ